MTGAAYESRKRPWLLRTPRHQADSTSRPAPGNRIRTSGDRQRPLVAREAGRDERDQERRREDADEDHDRDDEREQRADRAGDAVGLAPLAARHERGVHGNERRGERAFAEQVLEKVRDAERGVERVGGVGLQAEVVREDAQPDQAGRRLSRMPAATKTARAHSASSSTAASPSVPLDFLHQKRLDEAVEVAIQHAVDVADLLLGAMVLDQLVRVQHVAPDLIAEGDVLLHAADRVELRLLFLQAQIVQARLENLHRRIAIAMLRPLVLAGHDDAGGEVGDAHGRIGDVDVLPARAARAIGVDAQVLVFDVDVDVLGQLGPDVDRRERGVAPRGLVER